jgi:hypothetical protein
MPSDATAAFVLILCTVVIGGTLLGAVFLRAAIALYNMQAGGASSPTSVPEPGMGKAIGITFFTSVVQMVVGFLLDLLTSPGARLRRALGQKVDLVEELLPFAVALIVMAAMLSASLPTTFGRAIVVILCYTLIVILVAGPIVVIAIVLF